jgi:hypothetical protein
LCRSVFFHRSSQPAEPWAPQRPAMYDVDRTHRAFFQRRLFNLGIDPSHIKAHLDGVCETLSWQFDRGIAIGRFDY